MNIPFFDSNRVHYNYQSELEQCVLSVIRDGQYIQGTAIKILENSIQNYLNTAHAITCANGSEALTIAIQSLNIEAGSEVIIPSFNYVSAAESVIQCGLKVVFCDVDLISFNTTLALIQEQISPKTKLVIISHLFGLPMTDIAELARFCKKNNIFLIEDNAQSFGAKIGKKYVGTFGNISTSSFFPTKNLACAGDGGVIFTEDETLATKIRALCSHGQSQKYHFDFVGYNSRLDTLQAAILNLKLAHLTTDLELRWQNAQLYFEELKELKNIRLPKKDGNTFNQFTIRVLEGNRDLIRQLLHEKGISSMLYYPIPLHKQAAFKANDKQFLPHSELLCSTIFSLPIFPGLRSDEISYICSIIKEICE